MSASFLRHSPQYSRYEIDISYFLDDFDPSSNFQSHLPFLLDTLRPFKATTTTTTWISTFMLNFFFFSFLAKFRCLFSFSPSLNLILQFAEKSLFLFCLMSYPTLRCLGRVIMILSRLQTTVQRQNAFLSTCSFKLCCQLRTRNDVRYPHIFIIYLFLRH